MGRKHTLGFSWRDNPVNRIDPSGHGIDVGLDFGLDFSIGGFDVGFGFGVSAILGFGPAEENDFTPNWADAVGPVTHTLAYVDITFPSGSAQQYADQMYGDLQQFKYFYPPNNSSVSVSGQRAFFTPLGRFGAMSDLANPTSVAVQLVNGPGQDQLSAMTLGHHMLVGIRRWQSTVESARVVRVETEAYEQSNGRRNQFGRWLLGQSKQYEVWKDYLGNIANHWDSTAGATSSSVVTAPAQQVGSQNPWRSQLPQSLQ